MFFRRTGNGERSSMKLGYLFHCFMYGNSFGPFFLGFSYLVLVTCDIYLERRIMYINLNQSLSYYQSIASHQCIVKFSRGAH